MIVYIGKTGGPASSMQECSRRYLMTAAQQYARKYGIELPPEGIQLMEKSGGKPHFSNFCADFSVSHSGNFWVCAMGMTPVGIDIQKYKELDYVKVAERFFSAKEAECVKKACSCVEKVRFSERTCFSAKEAGCTKSDCADSEMAKVFFNIWVCKEAYVKFTGEGFAKCPFSSFSVITESGKIRETINCSTSAITGTSAITESGKTREGVANSETAKLRLIDLAEYTGGEKLACAVVTTGDFLPELQGVEEFEKE